MRLDLPELTPIVARVIACVHGPGVFGPELFDMRCGIPMPHRCLSTQQLELHRTISTERIHSVYRCLERRLLHGTNVRLPSKINSSRHFNYSN